VRSVVTVATPHRGTPLATWFRQFNAAALMRLLSLAAIHVTRVGPLPLGVARRLARLLGAGNGAASQNLHVIDQIVEELLADFGPERRRELRAFFREVGDDQTLLDELSPERLPAVLPPTPERSGVRYGAVVTRARKPWLGSMAELGFDATAQALHMVFRWLQMRTSAIAVPPQAPDERWTEALKRSYGEVPGGGDNDGIVPTRSQTWGEPIDVVWADHMDVLGHFAAPGKRPPHFDWLPSGSRYRTEQYQRTWNAVASFIASASGRDPAHA
jgi:hypothetical protein